MGVLLRIGLMYPKLCFLFVLFVLHAAAGQTCRISGSDWLGPVLQPALSESSDLKGIHLEMDFKGSIPAQQQVRVGEVDLAIVASPKEPDFGASFQLIPLGFEVALVGVSTENPLNEIHYDQLRGIFGASKNENISRWTDLGLSGAWSTRSIQPFFPKKGSGAALLFVHDVLGNQEVRPTVTWVGDVSEFSKRLKVDAGSIVVSPYMETVEAIKWLALAKGGPEAVAFNPTEENIFYGDYPLRLPLYLVFAKKPDAETLKVVQVLLSEEVAGRLGEAGICPLPKKVRERTRLGLDIK